MNMVKWVETADNFEKKIFSQISFRISKVIFAESSNMKHSACLKYFQFFIPRSVKLEINPFFSHALWF